ncbi:MAG: hypothetical protein IJR37_05105 [Schwartzia sp.]|nr:hypothetical protein [Schwartzia sp. (in: firmicutes)]
MDNSRMFSAAHGLNVTKTLLSAKTAPSRKTACGSSFAQTLVSVTTRKTTITVTKTTTEMTMAEYQEYIWEKIDSFPFSPTRPYDEQTIKISEKCWNRMKDDPEYEDKMMNIIKDGRQYPDPFFGMGSCGAYEVLDFDGGEGCLSHTFSKNFGGSKLGASNQFDKESEGAFWSNRRKRMKELYKESEERYLRRKKEMQMENLHVRKMRLMAQGKYEEAASVIGAGLPASLLLSGLGGTGTGL